MSRFLAIPGGTFLVLPTIHTIGAIDAVNDPERLSYMSSTLGCGLCREEDEIMERLIAFVIAGMKVPAHAATGEPLTTAPQ